MSREPRAPDSGVEPESASPIAVISAYGAFRLLLVLLALWSFFEGFVLFSGFNALSLGGADRTTERVIGLQMIGYVPVYGLLAWQRERYRLLVWVPYFAQLAIIVPVGWSVLTGNFDGILLLVVSITFFVLLFYFWWHSHPLDFYTEDDDEYDEDQDDDPEEGDSAYDEEDDAPTPPPLSRRGATRPPPRRTQSSPPAPKPGDTPRGRFRRRDS